MTNVMEENTYNDFWNKLEDVHDAVHGWVGGAMSAVSTAAYDPAFWSHHAMIDRLWYREAVVTAKRSVHRPPLYRQR